MTKDEWNKIKDWWGTGHGSVKMKIDGHEIGLCNNIDKERMIVEICLYIDGYMKIEYLDKESEIGNLFYQRVKKPLFSSKVIKERIKIFGKRDKLAQQKYHEYNAYSWRSFAAFKKHITTHNTEIQLISCGWENYNEPND